MDARCDCKRRRKQIPLGFPIRNAQVAHSPTKFSSFEVYFLLIWLIGHVQYCLHWTLCFMMMCLLFSSLLLMLFYIRFVQPAIVFLIVFHALRTETLKLLSVSGYGLMSVPGINISQSVPSGWQETIGPVLSDSFEVCLLTFGFNLQKQ